VLKPISEIIPKIAVIERARDKIPNPFAPR